MKKVVKLNEDQLKDLVNETVKKVIKESQGTDSGVYQTIDGCVDIILGTEKKGRRFAMPMSWTDATAGATRQQSVLNEDQEFLELREELIGCMQAYHNAAKQVVGYLYSSGYLNGNDYLIERAKRCLGSEFTPNW